MQGEEESLVGLIVVPGVGGNVFPVLPTPPSFLQTYGGIYSFFKGIT
jgi:hypothetical protein